MGQSEYEAAKVICDLVKTAEIIFRDEAGNELFTAYVGNVQSGETIEYKIPGPVDLSIKHI